MFKVLVSEACDPVFRAQLLRDFGSKPEYSTIPAPPIGNIQHQNIYLARCLTQQLMVDDMNIFLQSNPVRLLHLACVRAAHDASPNFPPFCCQHCYVIALPAISHVFQDEPK
jgi:hypothetical protein